MKNLNEYRNQAYKIACEHGFHEEPHSVEHWKCLIVSELMETDETDAGTIHYPSFRYTPTFEFTDEDIELIKWLANEEGETFEMLTE